MNAPEHPKSASTGLPSAANGRKVVLVPIDFSEASLMALRHAMDMATRENIHLVLLNLVDESASFRTLDAPALEHKRHEEHVEKVHQLVAREMKPKVSFEILVSEGNPTEEILRHAAGQHAQLIVLGRHYRHGVQHQLTHSHTTTRVMDKAPCPVTVIDEY